MKTVTELKKDLVVGKSLTLVYNYLSNTSETIKNRLGKTREIIQIQTNGIWLKSEDVTSKKSFLELPCASLIDYYENTIKFYKCGQRELTEGEKNLIDNEPSKRKENSELAYRDAISDGSKTYYMDKKYYKEHNAEWKWDWSKGLRYDINNGKMWDKKIKGDLDLEYIIEEVTK